MRWPAVRDPARPPQPSSERPTAPAVLLPHGLWRTPLSFLPLVRRLRRWGVRPEQFGYAAVAERYDAITERLVHRLRRLAGAGAPYVLLGHSFGGLLLRSALARLEAVPPAHPIMLGTPSHPPRLARALGVNWVYRRLLGECGIRLTGTGLYGDLSIPRVP